MLVAGLNYSNSLTLLLTFLLTGMVLIGIHECHRNLKGLRIAKAEVEDAFAGQSGRIELRFENTLPQARSGLALRTGVAAAEPLRAAAAERLRAPHRLRHRAPRPPEAGSHRDRHHRAARPVLRLELAAPAAGGDRLSAPLGSLPLPGGDGPRARQARTRAGPASTSGRRCGHSCPATARAPWPGSSTRAMRRCWCRSTRARPAPTACWTSPS